MADKWPQLPTGQAVPVPQVEERIDIVIGDDVLLSSFAVKGKHHIVNFISEEPVLEVAVEWTVSSVVFVGV